MRKAISGLVAACILVCGISEAQSPLDESFTYQGELTLGSSAPSGDFDFEFVLYDGSDPLAATMLGSCVVDGVPVTNGVFSVELNFGPEVVFNGEERWLEIRVSPAGVPPLTVLEPLQKITATPYSLYSLTARNADMLGGLDPGGYLSIGGGSVDGDLAVSGQLCLSGICRSSWPAGSYWNLTGNDLSYSDGNVAIGTTTADETLHVVGSARITGAAEGETVFLVEHPETSRLFKLYTGGVGTESAQDVAVCVDGGYIVVGSTDGDTAGGWDVLLLKYSQAGQLLWARTAGGSGNDNGRVVRQTADGGYIVAASTTSFGVSGNDLLLLRFNGLGALLWARTLGGSADFQVYGLDVTADGEFYVAGYIQSGGSDSRDLLVARLDSMGAVLWAKTVGGSLKEEGSAVDATTDGGAVVVGVTNSFGQPGEVLVLRFDGAGELVWATVAGGVNHEGAATVQQTTDGGFVVAGQTYSTTPNYADILVLKLESTGTISWARGARAGNDQTRTEVAHSVCETADGGYVVLGVSDTGAPSDFRGALLKLDSTGTLLWSWWYIKSYPRSLVETANGGFVFAGSNSDDLERGVLLVKTDANGSLPGCSLNAGLVGLSMTASESSPTLTPVDITLSEQILAEVTMDSPLLTSSESCITTSMDTVGVLIVSSDGKVGIRTSSPSYMLEVNGSAGKPGGGSWGDSSDLRLKQRIMPLDGRDAVAQLGRLEGVTFEWVNPEEHSYGTHAGVIAQDVEQVFPEWVEEVNPQGRDLELVPEGEVIKSVFFPHDFNAYLIEAIKYHQQTIEQLRAENEALLQRIILLERAFEERQIQ